MKILDKIILVIYSMIVLLESVIAIFLIFGWTKVETLVLITKDVLNNYVAYNIVFALSIIFIMLSIKTILFSSSKEKKDKSKKQDKLGDGVVLENDEGKLLISRDTIEKLASDVVRNFKNVQDFRTKVIIDAKNNIAIVIELQILQDTVIHDLNTNLQMQVKENIKKVTDLDVKEVNIKVKNIISNTTDKKMEEE